MLPKINRLKKKKDFDIIFKKGEGFRNKLLYLKVLDNPFEYSRFGFIVSKKVFNKAFLRNKIKRRLRETVRVKIKEIKKGKDVIIGARPGFLKGEIKELDTALKKLFKTAKLI